MARLSICLFGPFQVTLDGKLVTGFESDKARALLAYLAVESGHAHRREKLAGLLWPDWPESSARSNLAHVLAHLRSLIGDRQANPPYLLITRQSLQWNASSDALIDAGRFTSLLQGRTPSLQDLEQAVELYRGPFLEGFSLPDSAAFEEWALIERERLQRLALEALHCLAEGLAKQGEVARALTYAYRLTELDPWREPSQQLLLRLLARDGQRAAALSQYKAWRRRLADELDVEPAAETLALYQQIHDGSLAPSPQSAPATPSLPPHNLPAALTPFIGRKTELAELGQRLDDPDCRLLSLVGPGGIGKTRLALEAARARLSDYADGVFQVRLVGLASPESIVPAIAQAIGFRFHDEGDPTQQLLDYVRAKSMLLILDNFEHLLAGVEVVVQVLRAARGVRMVVTTRTRLKLKAEHLFPVDGLCYPAPLRLDVQTPDLHSSLARQMAEYDAVQLFLSGARRVCPGFELDGHTMDVARICHLVQGMPLAVLLASAWVESLSPAEIAHQLAEGVGRGLDLLEADWGDMPHRHWSIRAAFDHSWRLLSGQEQGIFAALSVFRGGFDAAAAEAVAGASPADLRRLVDRSFVQRLPPAPARLPSASLTASGAGGRYELHDLMRHYGSEKLDADSKAWQAAHDRHCAHYTGRVEAWDAGLMGARQYEALAEMDVEIDNARAAWDWAVGHEQLEPLDGAAEGLFRFYYFWRRGWAESDSVFGPAQEKLSAMVARTAPDRDSLPTSGYPDLLRVTAKIMGLCILSASDDQGAEFFQRALSILDRPELLRHDTRRERALILEMRARCFWTSNPARSARLEEESLALYRELGDRWETATRLLHLAYMLLRAPAGGGPDDAAWVQARHHLEESLSLFQDVGATRSVGLVLGQLGTLALLQGHRAQGERLLKQFITSWVEAGDTASLVHQLDSVAVTLSSMGRFDEGQFVMNEALALYKEMGDQTGEIMVRLRLGELLAYSGSYAESRAEARRVIAMARKPNDGAWIASARANLGRTTLGEGKWAKAQRYWEKNAAYNRQAGNSHTLALALAGQGLATLRQGDGAGARLQLVEALRLATAGNNVTTGVAALGVLSVILLDAGRIEQAVEIYAAVSQLPHFARSRFWEDIAGRHIAAAAATLPPEVAAAARERGRARDLMETAHEVLAELEAQMEETASASGGAPSPQS